MIINIKHIIIILLISIFGVDIAISQTLFVKSNFSEYRHSDTTYNNAFHSSIFPYLNYDVVNEIVNPDTNSADSSLFLVKKNNYFIIVNPVMASINNFDTKSKEYSYDNMAGFTFDGRFSGNFYFSGGMVYGMTKPSTYFNAIALNKRIIPGYGSAFGDEMPFNWFVPDLRLLYSANRHLNIEGGYGKHFIGEGYRSMLLSTNASSSPFLKIEATLHNLKYSCIWTYMKDITNSPEDGWFGGTDKFGVFQYLSWNIGKRVNLGLFESIISQSNNNGTKRGMEFYYLNPIAFLRPVEFGMGSPDNALMGINLSFKSCKKTKIYTQIMLDDFLMKDIKQDVKHILKPNDTTVQWGGWMNKQAGQIGIKTYDFLTIKNLNILSEINIARPYTYSHRYVSQNYGHFNQPLAHPLGSNFREWVSIIDYSRNRWYLDFKISFATTGIDTGNTHFGQDIFKPTFDTYYEDIDNVVVNQYKNKIAQGLKTNLLYSKISIGFIFNQAYGLKVEFHYTYREVKNALYSLEENMFGITLKTNLPERYDDF